MRRLSHRLHDERRKLSLMVESMADGLIMTDVGSEKLLINPAARRMLGIEPDAVVTTSYLKDRLGFYPFDLFATHSRTGDAPAPLREEVRVGDRSLHSMVSPVRDAAGNLVGVVVVLRDFTEAVELARRQRQFVSVVSHELRTPLTSITGALDIVLSEYAGRLSSKQRRYLQMARDSSTRLNVTIDDILDAARTERRRMPVRFAPIALDELGREAVERYRPAAQTKGIRLQVRTEGENIRLVADPDRLTQVLNNLLSNAVKFTPNRGEIEVEIFGPSVAAGHVGVSVFNNGEPIPDEARERVFESFEQLQDSDRRVGGTGLGLAISRSIVEAHGGRIWVESRSDGTKFVFTLPSAPAQEAEEDDPADATEIAAPPAAEPGTRVIIVDDDRYSTYILKGILMAAGHEVLIANEADDALHLARTYGPSVAVVNASMRTGDGLALVEIFKHDPDTRKLAVLVIASEGEREDALRSGADAFLSRPVEPQDFRDACARLIADAGNLQAHRILVVDDDDAIRLICRDVLANAGYAVREAQSGAAALVEAKSFRPDLLILDVMMPEMDGFQAAERFRAETSTSMMPIIFLSARGETADKVRAFRLGAEDYIVKPFDAAELVARVRKALERRDRELSASPTTQLPGSGTIEAEIERRLHAGGDDAFCYLDLDNLKAFNDYYGYAKADGVIRQTGDLVRDAVAREGSGGDFIGHIAGDDFVFITASEAVDRVCTTICRTFDRLVPLYYNKVDRERGHIETKDRYGVLRRFPIMGVSLAVVTRASGPLGSYGELAAAAARGKKLAKALAGSSYVRDGRIIIGAEPEAAPA
jgi:PAS domain S-box-containing protein